MVPGDIIEWAYKRDGSVVIEDEMLWSTLMNRWTLIGSGLVHTLVSINDEQITWLNEKGLFRARVDDARRRRNGASVVPVVPRARR